MKLSALENLERTHASSEQKEPVASVSLYLEGLDVVELDEVVVDIV